MLICTKYCFQGFVYICKYIQLLPNCNILSKEYLNSKCISIYLEKNQNKLSTYNLFLMYLKYSQIITVHFLVKVYSNLNSRFEILFLNRLGT